MSMDKLIEKIIETKNPTVAGLDPKLDFVPDYIKKRHLCGTDNPLAEASSAILEYNKGLIDELCDIVPAIKPQCAYYEMYGYYGVETLYKTMEYAKDKGMYVITDGKRNDIGPTMEAYAIGHMGETTVGDKMVPAFLGDSLTVNGYLGSDGINPLLSVCEKYDKGIFVLVKTSNKSSGELQDRLIDGKPVYEIMGEMCEKWGEHQIGNFGYSSVGAVVGATYPEQLATLRKKMSHTLFLVPGYGAQGGGAKDVSYAFDENGLGAIVNSSRGIICAYQKEQCDEKDYAKAARREAIRMREDILTYVTIKG